MILVLPKQHNRVTALNFLLSPTGRREMAPVPKNTNHPPPSMMHLFEEPHELSSFLHPHLLVHMIRNPQVPSRTHRICDVCRESIHGNFYHCKDCHFHVHSHCTHLPNKLRHLLDPNHKLRLHKLSSGRCSICKADCSSLWVYGCGVCKVNIHLNCLRKPFGSQEKTNQPYDNSRGIHHHAQPPWAAGQPQPQPHFYGGFPGWGHPSYNLGYPGHLQFAHNYNNHHQINHGGHGYGHAASSSSSILGSVLGDAMASLVGNLAFGSLTDFIFGSIGF